mmetsp:Transcript_12655/g.15967  ORF Transcript_12655/g.15967 Transcript_12655/m.15967 type:complete len:139 (+) Transcript_12655:146-562(+)
MGNSALKHKNNFTLSDMSNNTLVIETISVITACSSGGSAAAEHDFSTTSACGGGECGFDNDNEENDCNVSNDNNIDDSADFIIRKDVYEIHRERVRSKTLTKKTTIISSPRPTTATTKATRTHETPVSIIQDETGTFF